MNHNWLTGFRTGQLYVSMVQDVTPGEVWYGNTNYIARLDPLNKPAFMSLNIFTRKFFVPYRIIDDGFTDYWIGRDPDHVLPTINTGTGGFANVSMLEMLGVSITPERTDNFICNYPVRAYNKIWNHHFRPEGINEVPLDSVNVQRVTHPSNTYYGKLRSEMQLGDAIELSDNPTIPEVRDKWAIQRLQEHRAIYGEKYTDQLKRFGANAPAGLVDQPVPVASGKTVMGISEVVETATSAESTAGQMKGHGITVFGSNMKPRKFVEPGILMEVCYARPRLSLLENIPRIYHKSEDIENSFYQPELAVQSDAVVFGDEINAYNTDDNSNWAYIDNYEWLRSATDTTAGVIATHSEYQEYSPHKRLQTLPTLGFLQYVDDYDDLFQNGASVNRADIQLNARHKLMKYSPIRKKGRS